MRHNVPKTGSAAHDAMRVLYERGAMDLIELRAATQVVKSQGNFDTLMQSWIERGWLCVEAGKCDLTQMARRVFDGDQDKPSFIGIPATSSQINMMTRPPYRSPRSVRRTDIPAWSERPASFGFVTIGLREVAL